MKPGSRGFSEWLAYERAKRRRRRLAVKLGKDALAIACTIVVWAWLCGLFGWQFHLLTVLVGAAVGVWLGDWVWARIEARLRRKGRGYLS